ncbi:MAG: hypothetical protein FWC50_08325 [Planctomycetaceae bacterium]|nr:hypothetical protein [Planctomycetaceae bacterium]
MPTQLKPPVGSGTTSPQPQSTSNAERFPLNTVDSIPSNAGEKTMSINFETLAKAEQVKSIADYERYQNLLRDLAAGKEREEAEILEILERVGRNVNMLKEDYEWRAKRDEQIAEVKREEEYSTRKVELLAKLKSLREEFEKVEAEYNATRNPIIWESNGLDQKIRNISGLRGELVKSCRDPHLHDEIGKLESQRHTYASQEYLKEQSESIRRQLAFRQQDLKMMPALCPGRIEKVASLTATIKELQARYDKIQLEIDNLDRKEREIEAEKRKVYERMVFA